MRLILAHKQKTSARLRFLRFTHGLMAFEALPELAAMLDAPPEPDVATHPGVNLRAAEARLGLAPGDLALEPEFHAAVDSPDGAIEIRLATFTDIDPPFAAIERLGARFIAITEARDASSVELALLRLAYQVLLG